MNRFTKKGKSAGIRREQQKSHLQVHPQAFRLLLIGCMMCGSIFGAIALRVHLNEKIDKLEKEREAILDEQRSVEKRYKNLLAQKEEKTSLAFVQKKIREYNLDLRPTTQAQICHLKKYDSPAIAEKGQMLAKEKARRSDARTASLR